MFEDVCTRDAPIGLGYLLSLAGIAEAIFNKLQELNPLGSLKKVFIYHSMGNGLGGLKPADAVRPESGRVFIEDTERI